jgi:hypothetical protein
MRRPADGTKSWCLMLKDNNDTARCENDQMSEFRLALVLALGLAATCFGTAMVAAKFISG